MNTNFKLKHCQIFSKLFFYILLFNFLLNCAALPERKIPTHNYSQILNTKEYSPEKQTNLPPIILFDPILMKESAIYRIEENKELGLISSLNQEGYSVYLVSANVSSLDYKTQAMEIDNIINKIAFKHRNRDVYLAGLSLGGRVILDYLALPLDLNNYGRVAKIFFIGTGIDYNYTNSFYEKYNKLGYENKLVKDLCEETKKNNFCTRYIRYNNQLQKVDNLKKELFFNRIPKIEKENKTSIHSSKIRLPFLFIYGKLDSISPEESIYPFFHNIRATTAIGNNRNKFYEAGEANGHTIDYDHGDLFLYEKADKEIYNFLIEWLEN